MPDLAPFRQTIQFADDQGPLTSEKALYIPPPWRRDRGMQETLAGSRLQKLITSVGGDFVEIEEDSVDDGTLLLPSDIIKSAY